MNAQESISIMNTLRRNSYTCDFNEELQCVVVKDPVQSSLYSETYNDVKIKSFSQCIHFIEERS